MAYLRGFMQEWGARLRWAVEGPIRMEPGTLERYVTLGQIFNYSIDGGMIAAKKALLRVLPYGFFRRAQTTGLWNVPVALLQAMAGADEFISTVQRMTELRLTLIRCQVDAATSRGKFETAVLHVMRPVFAEMRVPVTPEQCRDALAILLLDVLPIDSISRDMMCKVVEVLKTSRHGIITSARITRIRLFAIRDITNNKFKADDDQAEDFAHPDLRFTLPGLDRETLSGPEESGRVIVMGRAVRENLAWRSNTTIVDEEALPLALVCLLIAQYAAQLYRERGDDRQSALPARMLPSDHMLLYAFAPYVSLFGVEDELLTAITHFVIALQHAFTYDGDGLHSYIVPTRDLAMNSEGARYCRVAPCDDTDTLRHPATPELMAALGYDPSDAAAWQQYERDAGIHFKGVQEFFQAVQPPYFSRLGVTHRRVYVCGPIETGDGGLDEEEGSS